MRLSVNLLAACLFVVVVGSGVVIAKEEAVPLDKIPKAVMDSLLAKFPKAKIDKCTKEKEGDDVIYDIEFKEEGRKCEADIKEDGTIVNFEKAIEARDLPKAVSEAIDKRYPKAKYKEVMEETEMKGKEGKLVAYEVVLLTADNKEVEVKVTTTGEITEDSGAK